MMTTSLLYAAVTHESFHNVGGDQYNPGMCSGVSYAGGLPTLALADTH